MKLLVVSDTHGDAEQLEHALEKENDADALIFLGDGVRDTEDLEVLYPKLKTYIVSGNCDIGSFFPMEGLAAFGGLLFFYTHGHIYDVKNGLYKIAQTAKQRGADAVLFGHTHCPLHEEIDGVTLFNPGSLSVWCGRGNYGVITIRDGKAEYELCRLEAPHPACTGSASV